MMKTRLEKTKMTRTRAVFLGLLLAATLALTLGAVADATEAKKVPSLRKGVTNLVQTVTTMVGFVSDDAVLRLDNDSSEGNATALDLQVEAGKAPMRVNSDIRVDNLNADKIDDQDSTAFFFGKTYTKSGDRVAGTDGQLTSASAVCDTGDIALSGGYGYVFLVENNTVFFENTEGDKYTVGFEGSHLVEPNVTCTDFPPLRGQ
jgi:hypothetical protein